MTTKIYKITSDNTLCSYIGSTRQSLSDRYGDHKRAYKEYISGLNKKCCTSVKIFIHGDTKIELVEDLGTCTDLERRKREAFHIKNTLGSVNVKIPAPIDKEITGTCTKYNKKYYDEYNKVCSDIRRKYRNENKDKLKKLHDEWREKNKEYYKEWKEKNKDYHKEWMAKNRLAHNEYMRVYMRKRYQMKKNTS